MRNNISRADLDAVIEFLGKDDPILTQSENVRAFEKEWSEWLGVDYSVFVNSGASANLLTMSALKYIYGPGEVIVPSLTWVSDIASVIQSGLKPVFVDIDPFTLGMDTEQVLDKLNSRTRAVFLTHTLGYNALNDKLLDELKAGGVPLIEDVCESHGATYNNKKLGAFGWISNFSFYYAHHLSTIEGGMVCTSDPEVYYIVRMLRSHGMVRESGSLETKTRYRVENPDLNPDFIFAYPAYNMRNTEINAVIGRNQLKRLNENNRKRTRNLHIFLEHLDAERFQTCFNTAGSSNYAFTLILNAPDLKLRNRIEKELRENKVEFRRGTAGGGNQLRQPYLRRIFGDIYKNYPAVDHVHFFGWYIGNYPDLEEERIIHLCRLLNGV
ncbi:MAG: DegT/DnrJ/EryC1/StrS aminotransferase family protein [Verrucomicrobia bacterium]|nr:DegT/DnrJ/EryC1/StrS aminotransferase family protein [Verrucomicrobiota bacterium]